jgi:hypothetical protein
MSKYDEERKALGLKPINSSTSLTQSTNTKSKYDDERNGLVQTPMQETLLPTTQPIIQPTQQSNNAPDNKLLNAINWADNKLKWFNNSAPAQFLQATNTAFTNATGIGLLNKVLNPEDYQKNQQQLEQHPVANLIGSGIGYIAPFSAASKVVSKIPALSTPAATTLGRIGQGALRTGLEGTLVGGVQNSIKGGIDYAQGNGNASDIAKRELLNTGEFGLGSAIFGGLGTVLGEGITGFNKNLTNKGFENEFNNIFSGYKPSIEPFNPTKLPKITDIKKVDGTFRLKPITKEVPIKSNGYFPYPQDINNKTWYHGTGTENLTPDKLSPNATKIEGLFGHGIYLTDTPEIAKGYAMARGKNTNTPSIYESNVKVNKVLDLEKQMPKDAFDTFDELAKGLDNYYGYNLSDELNNLNSKGATGDEIYRSFADGISEISHQEMVPKSEFVELFQELSSNLKGKGYDAYTHIGGKRTGKEPHQVLIMLDPNGEFSSNDQIGQITKFNKLSDINEMPKQLSIHQPSLSEFRPRNILPKNNNISITQQSNIPLETNLPPNTESRIVSSQSNTKPSLLQRTKDKWNDLYTNWVDSQNPLKQFSNTAKNGTAYKTAINSKKVNSTVDYIFNKGLVDKEGNKIGESLKDIVQSVSKDEEIPFMNYLLHKHNINRVAENKPIFSDYSPQDSASEVLRYEQLYPEFKQTGDRLRTFLDNFSEKWMKDTGLTTDTIMNDLKSKYPNYIPTQREYSELEKGFSGGAKSGYVDQPSGIKKATGSDRNVLNPLENIMNLVNRTVRTARRNEVGQEIVNAISQNPQALSKYAEILPSNYQGRLDLDNIVTVRINGDPIHLKINDKRFLDTIKDAANNTDINGVMPKINNLFKGLITQYNPVFALRNIARDLPTSYIYGSERNPVKFGKDLLTAGKEMLKHEKQYEQYQALGGGSSNFFFPSNVTIAKENLVNLKTPLRKKLLNGIEAFNNFTETVPRLAEFQRTLKKGGTPQEALYNAGETTINFSRGGNEAKNLDKKLVPYLNASIQGLDRLARGVKSNPIGMIGKGLTAITAPTVIQEAWNKSVDPEGYRALDNRTKDAYFVFAQGDGKFIKIPKSRELAVLFSSLFQRLYRKNQGDENAFKGFGTTVATNFSPTNPFESNIVSPALSLKYNKDFANRDIVPQYMKNLSPELQYDEKTSELAKKIGEVAKLSPKEIDYIIKSYTGVIGQMGLPALTKGGSNLKPLTSQFTSDSAYSNQDVTDFYDNINKLTTVAADRNVNDNIPSKVVTPEERLRGIFTKQSQRMSMLRKIAKDGTEEEKRQAQKDIAELAKIMNNTLKQ